MRVMHVCLANFYIDNYGYQENIITKTHKLQGHNVMIVASTETYLANNRLGYVKASSYDNEDGIPVRRLPYVSWLPDKVVRKLRIYRGLREVLEQFQPEVLFLHDAQFLSIGQVVNHVKRHPGTAVYVDGHTDFGNSARNWVSRNILHKMIYRRCVQAIEPFTTRFYGVLPARVDFFKEVYHVPAEKVELLQLGVDDTLLEEVSRQSSPVQTRAELGILDNQTVIINGGKFSFSKPVDGLVKAAQQLGENYALIVFGRPDEAYKETFDRVVSQPNIHYVGWINPRETMRYMLASDVAVFPGTHSVLWEQAAGAGLPCFFRKWPGMQHLNYGGNCIYMEDGDAETIYKALYSVLSDPGRFSSMKESAKSARIHFSYDEIARKAIQDN